MVSALNVLLKTWKEHPDGAFASVLLRAISSSRLDDAIQFLRDLVKNGAPRQAAAAAEALKLHDDPLHDQADCADDVD
jgi:hypothetical protein